MVLSWSGMVMEKLSVGDVSKEYVGNVVVIAGWVPRICARRLWNVSSEVMIFVVEVCDAVESCIGALE